MIKSKENIAGNTTIISGGTRRDSWCSQSAASLHDRAPSSDSHRQSKQYANLYCDAITDVKHIGWALTWNCFWLRVGCTLYSYITTWACRSVVGQSDGFKLVLCGTSLVRRPSLPVTFYQYFWPWTAWVRSPVLSVSPPHRSLAKGDGQNKVRKVRHLFFYRKTLFPALMPVWK